jgi:predicted ATPase/class 3 adenylate cyclase/Tfp pilus assembly protein PilF
VLMAGLQEVTFLFTDIEGSTQIWQQHPEAMPAALARHDEILRQTIEGHGGHIFKTMGDAFYAAFDTASEALAAAWEAQRALHEEPWGETGPLRVRMALHSGTAEDRDGDFFGLTLNRVARLLHAGHGGQILLSRSAQELVLEELPAGTDLRDLGERRLKDLVCLEHIFQLVAPDLPADFPPLNTLDARPTNLPAQPTLLIGREEELAEVCTLLRRGSVRLVTLTGPGGTGKTRLGLQVAADLLDGFADGAFFVPLSPIRDADLVLPQIAQVLELKESTGRPLLDSLKTSLRDKELLLVLDNFEQVLTAAPVLTDLLAAAPGLKLLVTSRALLRVYGEYEYRVPPLARPDLDQLPDLEGMEAFPAVTLFVERTRAVRPGFSLTEENAPAVAEICIRLDGLPLAIELAAARSRLFSPQAMVTRFQGPPRRSSLDLLAGGPRDLPARQQTLRGAIEWSYDLLDELERCLFARLAVFLGGCTIEAVEAVCNAASDLELDIVEGLLSLVDQSVLRQEEGVDCEPRFVMLETIREYALERLAASGDGETMQRQHAAYYLGLAEMAKPELSGPRQLHWLSRLEEEHDNLRAALAWALECREIELALSLSETLGSFWYTRGFLSEGRRWLERVLEDSRSLSFPALRARALAAVGELAHAQGDYERGRRYVEDSLSLRQELGDKAGIAASYHRLAGIVMYEGDPRTAQQYYEKSLALRRELGLDHLIPSLLNNLGLVAMYQDDLERAMQLHEESLVGFRELGNMYGVVSSLLLLGLEASKLEQYDRAAEYCCEALALLGEQGDVRRVIEGLEIYAGVLVAQGKAERAAHLCGAAEALRDELGIPLPPVDRPFVERIRSSVQEQLGEAGLAEAWTEGRAMSEKQAVDCALGK